jgi:mannitol-1-phosphate 5-dehydrogenase
LLKDLNPIEQKLIRENTGLVEASIGRMVPLQTDELRGGNPLRICVEPYAFLPVDKAAFRGEIPSLAGMYPFDNFDFYIQRKLFIHNMGHAVCAYLGLLKGDNFIYETVNSAAILFIAQNAMMESAVALSIRYGASLQNLHYHIRDLLRRFSNKALGDTCARVGADTRRKLGNRDRLIGALLCCGEEGVIPAFISVGIGAALCCHLNENADDRGRGQSREAAAAALKELSGLEESSAFFEQALFYHSMFASVKTGGSFDEIIAEAIKAATNAGRKSGVI